MTRSGLTARVGAFLERAAALTPDPVRRAGRTLAAAQVSAASGHVRPVGEMVRCVERLTGTQP
jgi:hypothetical protein